MVIHLRLVRISNIICLVDYFLWMVFHKGCHKILKKKNTTYTNINISRGNTYRPHSIFFYLQKVFYIKLPMMLLKIRLQTHKKTV